VACQKLGYTKEELLDMKSVDITEASEKEANQGIIKDITQKKEFKFVPFPKFAQSIIKAGGLLNYIK